MRNSEDIVNILVVDSMTRIDLQVGSVSQFCRLDETCEFDLPVGPGAIGQRSSMEFNELGAEVRRGQHLRFFRIDEKTHDDAALPQKRNRGAQRGPLSATNQAPFGRYLPTILGDETDIIGQDVERKFNDLWRIAHFQVKLGGDSLLHTADIPLLNVTPINTQMRRDTVRTGLFRRQR